MWDVILLAIALLRCLAVFCVVPTDSWKHQAQQTAQREKERPVALFLVLYRLLAHNLVVDRYALCKSVPIYLRSAHQSTGMHAPLVSLPSWGTGEYSQGLVSLRAPDLISCLPSGRHMLYCCSKGLLSIQFTAHTIPRRGKKKKTHVLYQQQTLFPASLSLQRDTWDGQNYPQKDSSA